MYVRGEWIGRANRLASCLVLCCCSSGPSAGTCGDGVVDRDLGEECDIGAGGLAPFSCNPDCIRASCGDGFVGFGEACDPGLDAACPSNCSVCGDGVVQAAEECDDGNDVVGDGCSLCRPAGYPLWRAPAPLAYDVHIMPSGAIAVLWVRCSDECVTSRTEVTRFSVDGEELESFVVPGLEYESVVAGRLDSTPDNGYVIGLTIRALGTGADPRSRILIARYSPTFVETWRRELPLMNHNQSDTCRDIALGETTLVMGGLSHEGFGGDPVQDNYALLTSVDLATGDEIFTERYRDTNQNSGTGVDVGADGTIALAGEAGMLSGPTPEASPFVWLVDPDGTVIWRTVVRSVAAGATHDVSLHGGGRILLAGMNADFEGHAVELDAATGSVVPGSSTQLGPAAGVSFVYTAAGSHAIAVPHARGLNIFVQNSDRTVERVMSIEGPDFSGAAIAMDDTRIYTAGSGGLLALGR